jgi:hypothetical protein
MRIFVSYVNNGDLNLNIIKMSLHMEVFDYNWCVAPLRANIYLYTSSI